MKNGLILIFVLLLAGTVGAQDATPYKFAFGGNNYFGPRNATVSWCAEHYDMAINWSSWGKLFFDSLYDTALTEYSKDFWCGPYASSQEVSLVNVDVTMSYAERLTDTAGYWEYVYARHYMDSIGVDEESLVVHYNDDMLAITQQYQGYRKILKSGLNSFSEQRWSYQYWGNDVTDTFCYPSGYSWMANATNADARRAYAYAYRRYFLEDSAKYGPGDHHWTVYFMDNQYRDGESPRLPSYYTLDSTRGGATSDLDWVEIDGIGTTEGCSTYYDAGVLLLDSTIAAVMDEVCSDSISLVRGFANVDKAKLFDNVVSLRHTNITLEFIIDWDNKSWSTWWSHLYGLADSMLNHRDRYVLWEFRSDYLCVSDPGHWAYDSSRIYMATYAFWLTVRDTNAFISPSRFNDTLRWRDIYEVDFGAPDSSAYKVDSQSTGSHRWFTFARDYGGDSRILFTIETNDCDPATDTVTIALDGDFYAIDVNGDTALTTVSSVDISPFMGWAGTTVAPSGGTPSGTPDAGTIYEGFDVEGIDLQ